jgi:multiple antibiotic resistance protein
VNLKLLGEVFVTLLVIVDPPGMVPVFLALTGTMSAGERMRAATQAVGLALGVIVGFAVAGQTLLDYLHVKLPALQGAGGLLLVLVALQLLTGKTDAPEDQALTTNVALVPIGTPLLAGPGAIVATMLFVRRADGFSCGSPAASSSCCARPVSKCSPGSPDCCLRPSRCSSSPTPRPHS